jgi:ABC-type polysaccharide transport system permease subunit
MLTFRRARRKPFETMVKKENEKQRLYMVLPLLFFIAVFALMPMTILLAPDEKSPHIQTISLFR